MNMKIALDTNPLYVTQAGVARYIRGLQEGLAKVAPRDLFFFDSAWKVTNFRYEQPLRAIKTIYRELFWYPFCAPRQLLRERAQVFHSTGPFVLIPPNGVKHVVTLHDLAILRHPERFRPWCRRGVRKSLFKLHRAHRVLCISEFTADEAMKLLGLPASQIDVVYNGCDFNTSWTAKEIKPDFHVPSEFFLFVGSLEPGKNLSLLREVYLLADKNNTPLPPLIIVGARWEGVAGEGAPPKNWHYAGRISDDALAYLYKRATALVFPSKYEGFGFPLLEAMGLGCPVICSPVASLPEVAGDAALLPPLEPAAYLKTMLQLVQKTELRDELICKGYAQSRKFSWEKCARETIEVYRHAMA